VPARKIGEEAERLINGLVRLERAPLEAGVLAPFDEEDEAPVVKDGEES
jgi:hypothetical protein